MVRSALFGFHDLKYFQCYPFLMPNIIMLSSNNRIDIKDTQRKDTLCIRKSLPFLY